jgi:hypothetical protein
LPHMNDGQNREAVRDRIPAPPRERAVAAAPGKACASCSRIAIGANYEAVSAWRVFLALPFIYLPVLILPFVLLGAGLAYVHLRLLGAKDLKGLGDFLPAWSSHRYTYKTQIVKRDIHPLASWARLRLFWFFNCTLYCPFSVGALEWAAYLTKAVENWWCPFGHSRKAEYASAALDGSFWHGSRDEAQLDPRDRCNPIWSTEDPLRAPTGRAD